MEGIFPDSLKTALIVPIYKKGEPLDVNNYRPISILSVLSKIFERILYNRMIKFLYRFNLLTGAQHGF